MSKLLKPLRDSVVSSTETLLQFLCVQDKAVALELATRAGFTYSGVCLSLNADKQPRRLLFQLRDSSGTLLDRVLSLAVADIEGLSTLPGEDAVAVFSLGRLQQLKASSGGKLEVKRALQRLVERLAERTGEPVTDTTRLPASTKTLSLLELLLQVSAAFENVLAEPDAVLRFAERYNSVSFSSAAEFAFRSSEQRVEIFCRP